MGRLRLEMPEALGVLSVGVGVASGRGQMRATETEEPQPELVKIPVGREAWAWGSEDLAFGSAV